MTSSTFGPSFDVRQLLAPREPYTGQMILDVPEGISPTTLRDSAIGQQFIHQTNTWYDAEPWAIEPALPGMYELRLPIPGSNGKTFERQKALLFDGEAVASLVLVELAMLCLKSAGLPNPLRGGFVRCAELFCSGHSVELDLYEGRVRVNSYWNGFRAGNLWLAGCRKVS